MLFHPIHFLEYEETYIETLNKLIEDKIKYYDQCIRDGLTIGNNSVIGMGSVVVKDVDNNIVIAGNPGKMLRLND